MRRERLGVDGGGVRDRRRGVEPCAAQRERLAQAREENGQARRPDARDALVYLHPHAAPRQLPAQSERARRTPAACPSLRPDLELAGVAQVDADTRRVTAAADRRCS